LYRLLWWNMANKESLACPDDRAADESSGAPAVTDPNRPVNERVAAIAVGKFVPVTNGIPGPTTVVMPYRARAPPLLGYSIKEFCEAVGISVAFFYELRQAGLAPRCMKGLGTRQIISVEEAQRWCRERTESSAS
jgi:hypothetical protein